MCAPYSTEEMLGPETRSLPTERLGNAYFSSILADTKARARKAPELLREVLAADDVVEAVNPRDKR
ncbi:hypothetical protein [Myxococcus sp. AB036A]|uniref:hypothetical protein n=1 Tax=Myxococcus sp. AB036A TaxID=2562793 RepID=UPI00129CACA7|nr:hypothetical protein [Myxococcus sp. AB036A]